MGVFAFLLSLVTSPYVWALVSILVVSLVYLWYSVAYAPFKFFKKRGIKGPTPVAVFGNALEFGKADVGPMEFYMGMTSEYGKLCGYYLGSYPVYVVTDSDMLKQILVKQFDNFTDRFPFDSFESILISFNGGLPLDLTMMPGDEWRESRRLVTPTFSSKSLRLMTPLVEKSCVSLVKRMELAAQSDKSVEMKEIACQFSLEVILASAFGHQIDILGGKDADDELYKASKVLSDLDDAGISVFASTIAIMSHLPKFVDPLLASVLGYFFSSYIKPSIHFANLSRSLVQARRRMPTTDRADFMQLLIDASSETSEEKDAKPSSKRSLSDDEVVSMASMFILAGFDTTSNLLGFTSYLLALNPDKQDKLLSEIDEYYAENPEADLYTAANAIEYAECVLNESLRCYPPVQQITRMCSKTSVVGDVTIPKGALVDIPIFMIHHLPEHWDDPDEFIPERFYPDNKANHHPMSFMPFGWGPRNCIGLRFAMMEAKMALVSVMRKVKFERSPDTEVPLKIKLGSTLNAVHVKVVTRI